MDMNIDPSWLLKMAEKEDNKIVSVGGLAAKLGVDISTPTVQAKDLLSIKEGGKGIDKE